MQYLFFGNLAYLNRDDPPKENTEDNTEDNKDDETNEDTLKTTHHKEIFKQSNTKSTESANETT